MTVAGQIPTKGAAGQKTAVKPKTTRAKTATKAAPSKAVAKVDKDKLPSDLTAAKAKALTAKIKKAVGTIWQDMAAAAEGRAWKAMGYKNWNDWMQTEFGDAPTVLMPKDRRKEAVKELVGRGFSTRAAADILRTSKSQVDRDIQELRGEGTVPGGTVSDKPEGGDSNVIDIPEGDITEVPEGQGDSEPPQPAPTITRDDRKIDTTNIGKKPTVVNVVSAARTLSKDIENVRVRLDSLFSREDYEENKVDVQGTLETAVGDLIDTLVEEFGDMIRERLPEPEPAV